MQFQDTPDDICGKSKADKVTPQLTQEEFRTTELNNGKAAGHYNIKSELINYIKAGVLTPLYRLMEIV